MTAEGHEGAVDQEEGSNLFWLQKLYRGGPGDAVD